MEYIVISITALFVSSLTLFSGFGLGPVLMPAVTSYQIGERTYELTLVKLVIGILIIVFALFDLVPGLQKLAFERKYLPLGGILSGFFGGFSGNQGAMRSAFLLKSGLDTKSFVGTNAVSAFIVDIVRLIVYSATFYTASFTQISGDIWVLVLLAIFFAFIGSLFGAKGGREVTLITI